jgi:hypothetical protein
MRAMPFYHIHARPPWERQPGGGDAFALVRDGRLAFDPESADAPIAAPDAARADPADHDTPVFTFTPGGAYAAHAVPAALLPRALAGIDARVLGRLLDAGDRPPGARIALTDALQLLAARVVHRGRAHHDDAAAGGATAHPVFFRVEPTTDALFVAAVLCADADARFCGAAFFLTACGCALAPPEPIF